MLNTNMKRVGQSIIFLPSIEEKQIMKLKNENKSLIDRLSKIEKVLGV